MRVLLLLIALAACQRNGKVIGPSGIAAAGTTAPSCVIPCETLADCQRIRPAPLEPPFVWLSCSPEGACIDVECITDGDCLNSFSGGRKCVTNQCAPVCSATVKCPDLRDVCTDGYCLRAKETPQPSCSGPGCECTADGDCPTYAPTCRSNNECRNFQSEWGTAGWGHTCVDDDECGRHYFAQDMFNAGLSLALVTGPASCGVLCEDGFTPCGQGFTCKNVASSDKGNMIGRRSFCLPNACAEAACGGTYALCDDNAQCPSDESCLYPETGCRGVCVKKACASCTAWRSAKQTRVCLKPKAPIVNIDVRRPD